MIRNKKPFLAKESFHMNKTITATILTVTLLLTVVIQPVQAATFKDVPKNHWAYESINVISNKGIINGYVNGNFAPNDRITRAQSAKIVALAIQAKPTDDYTPSFKDVSKTNTFYNHIRALTQREIFHNGTAFNPNDSLTRGQMAKIIARSYNIILDDNDLIHFKDVPESNGFHPYITAIAEIGITKTKEGTSFLPNEPVTRAQMAAFIQRAMEFQSKLETGEVYYDKTQKRYIDKNYSIPAPPETDSAQTISDQTIKLVNKNRQQQNLAALQHDKKLSAIAQKKAEDMANNNYFAHVSPTYGSVGNMLDHFNYNWTSYGENIAKGYKSPDTVVDDWMQSPGHRANILQSKFQNIGSGYATDPNGTTYWVHLFSTK